MDYKTVFDMYVRLFENTFVVIADATEVSESDDFLVVGTIGENPYTMAENVGKALLDSRFPSLSLPIKNEGESFLPLSSRIYGPADLVWRDRPVWDSFDVCQVCGFAHEDGVDPWIKEPVGHAWVPTKAYTIYMRFEVHVRNCV